MAHKTNSQLCTRNGGTLRPSATIVRLPLFRDGVFIGNEFIEISSRLRTKIRQMALEGRR
jgi:hypothetical protein